MPRLAHQICPPQDFQKFVAEIRELWISGGLIVDDLNANPNHHDPNYGPNLYQVNEQYVKLGWNREVETPAGRCFFLENGRFGLVG